MLASAPAGQVCGPYPAMERRHHAGLKLALIPRWSALIITVLTLLDLFRFLYLCSCHHKEAEYAPKFLSVIQTL